MMILTMLGMKVVPMSNRGNDDGDVVIGRRIDNEDVQGDGDNDTYQMVVLIMGMMLWRWR